MSSVTDGHTVSAVEPTSIRMLLWNPCSIVNKREEFQKVVEEYDVIILVETWLRGNITLDYSSFNLYKQNRDSQSGGGIAFLIRRNYSFMIINELNNVSPTTELCGIKITNLCKPITILACYCPPGNGTLSEFEWDTIINNTTHHEQCILMSDFNAHNETWNCKNTDVDGTRLFESAEKYNLFLHNTDTNSHIDPSTLKKSNLELIFSSVDTASYLHYYVMNDNMGSDHFPIAVTVDAEKCI